MLACRSINKMAGGVERQIIALANELSRRDHSVALFTSDEDSAVAFYPLVSDVCWYRLGMGNPLHKASWPLRLKRMKKVRRILKEFRPEVVVAFQPGTFIGLRFYGLGLGIPMIASLRNAASIFDFTRAGQKKNRIYQLLRMADRITVQFPSYVDALPPFLRRRARVIPNAIEQAKECVHPDEPHKGEWTLLAVGRLSFQKNYHLLIGAFGQLAKQFSNWSLVIAGEGGEYDKLEKSIVELDMSKRVRLLGNVEDVESLYVRSHLFCQPSLWEGFPNSLSEALAHGLPSVGFAHCSGVNELITHGENGLLAESENSLAKSLATLMESPERRRAMGKKAVESMEQYRPERCFDAWERVLGEVVEAG